MFEVEEVSKRRGGYDQRSQRDRRVALVAFDLTDDVLGTRCRRGRLFGGGRPDVSLLPVGMNLARRFNRGAAARMGWRRRNKGNWIPSSRSDD